MKLDIALILSILFVSVLGTNAIADAGCATIDLIKSLSDNDFAIREPARIELTQILGDPYEASATREAIRTALRDCPYSLEAIRRLQNLVKLWDLSDVDNWSTIMRNTISNGASTDTKILAARDVLMQIKGAVLSNARFAEVGDILREYNDGLIELSDAGRAELVEEYNDILTNQILNAIPLHQVSFQEVRFMGKELPAFSCAPSAAVQTCVSTVVEDRNGTEYTVMWSETNIEVKSTQITWIDLPLRVTAPQGVQFTGNSVRLPLPTFSWERPRGSTSGSIALSWRVIDDLFALTFLDGAFPDFDFSTAERNPAAAAREAENTFRTMTLDGSGRVSWMLFYE